MDAVLLLVRWAGGHKVRSAAVAGRRQLLADAQRPMMRKLLCEALM
jgi:hypothetical protein